MYKKLTAAVRAILIVTLLLAMTVCTGALADSYDGETMRLLHYEGSVEIFDPAGTSRFVLENVRFASGEVMQTGAESTASVSLDDTKIVTLDAETRVEFLQEGSHFLLKLIEGTIFLDVQEKLDENESLDIQTATLTVGIRGTMIAMTYLPGPLTMENAAGPASENRPQATGGADASGQVGTTSLFVMEGTTITDYVDQFGAHRSDTLSAGNKMVAVSAGVMQNGTTAVVSQMTGQDMTSFMTNTILSSENLIQRVIEGSENGEDLLNTSGQNANGNGDDSFVEPYPANAEWEYGETVTLVAQSASKLYDGTPLTRPTDVLVSGLPEGCSIRVAANGSRTEVGKSDNEIVNYTIYNKSGQDITAHFPNVDLVSGYLRVDPAPLTIWTGSATKYYDGQPLTNQEAEIRTVPGHEVDEPTWRNTSIVTRTAMGSETMVGVSGVTWVHGTNPLTGETKQIVLYTGQRLSVCLNNQTDGQSIIEFVVEDVDPQKLPEDVLRLYADNPDLLEQACKDAEWDLETMKELVKEYKTSSEEDVVTKLGLSVAESASEDVMQDSSNVRIVVDTQFTMYNSRPLTGNEAHFTPIVVDPSIEVTATGSQTAVGESDNTYTITWGNADKDNYVLEDDLGKLTVLPLRENNVVVTAASDAKVYDGTPLEASGFEVTGLPEGFSVEATVEGALTDAGTAESTIASLIIYDERGQDATNQFAHLSTVSGTLTVDRAPLTISTGSASKAYDGEALTSAEAAIEGLVNGETASVTATGTITEVGKADNTFTVEWGTAQESNYSITEELGTLEVTKAPVTISTGSASKVYDGEALTSAEASIEGLADGETATVTATGTITTAGTADNTYTIEWGTAQESNYDVSESLGTLEVEALSLQITCGGAKTMYDGSTYVPNPVLSYANGPHAGETVSGTRLRSVNLLYRFTLFTGDTVDLTITESGKDAGTYTLTSSVTMSDGISANASVDLSGLTITVEPAELSITTGSASKAYDGEELTSAEVTVTGLADGESITVTPTGTITNVGTADNTYTIDWGTTNPNNYTVTDSLGTLEVEQMSLSLDCGGATVTYDGEEYFPYALITYSDGTHAGETIEGMLLSEETPHYVFTLFTGDTAEATISGMGADANTYTLTAATNCPAYAKINPTNQTLVVQPCPITAHTGSASKYADGLPLYCEEAEIYNLPDFAMIDITATGVQTAVGSSTNTYEIDWLDENEDNYTVTEDTGTLTVTAWETPIVIKAGSATKMYDGLELTNEEYEVTGLPDGWSVEATTSGSQRLVASSANTVASYTLYNADEDDITSTYPGTVTKVAGSLEVKANTTAITVSTNADRIYYAGLNREYTPGCTCSYSSDGVTIEISQPAVVVGHAGTYTANAPTVTFYDKESGESVNSYFPDVTCTGATITVQPIQLSVVLYGDTVDYDAQYHGVSNAAFTAQCDDAVSFGGGMWDTKDDTEFDYDEWTLLFDCNDGNIMAAHFYATRYSDPGTYTLDKLKFEVEEQFLSTDIVVASVTTAELVIEGWTTPGGF